MGLIVTFSVVVAIAYSGDAFTFSWVNVNNLTGESQRVKYLG